MKKNKILVLIAILVLQAQLKALPFDALWRQMQSEYSSIQYMSDTTYSHESWKNTVNEIRAIVLGPPQPNFFLNDPILRTMLRTSVGPMQYYEINYLNNIAHAQCKHMLDGYRDISFGGIPLVPSIKRSVSTLGHLFYAARILESPLHSLRVAVELGGGYGNMARIFQQFFPESVYIIIDLPEILALQWLFLKGTGNENVYVCTEIPQSFKKGIYLMPNALVKHLVLKADVFISNFALSECSYEMQRSMVEKKFFNAESIYITGQLANKWPEGWVPHHYLKNEIEKIYSHVEFSPFQEGKTNDHSYELRARKGNSYE